ncbi:MAG: LPS assembly protein LptD [Paracoccus sp. (in: a-proteobacteria)]|nr:LPS assembly protein LptD [Paracoccus sp. (in: a-proteobacteria)]
MIRNLLFPLAIIASSPALGQSAPDLPWWLPAGEGANGSGAALAPTTDLDRNAPLADGTELSSLYRQMGAQAPAITITPTPEPDDSGAAATLLADRIELSGDRTLTATGGVVVWYQGARLVAQSVRYDGPTGAMQVTGPIHLTRAGASAQDEAILIADQADLSQDMREGMLRGARLVLAREMQMAAREVTLTGEGRYTTLTHVVASSCQICAEDPTPLWEIRARQITHDRETRQLILDYPQLRAFGLPVAAWPGRITAPDPTVERMSGFLRPRMRTTSGLGAGLQLPYFVTLGDHADVTLTPYLTTQGGATLGLRYRQAYAAGATEWSGAISRDRIRPGDTRGYLFGAAVWELPRGYRLGAQLQVASDRSYLLDYGISDADRLWSGVTLDRVARDRLLLARIGNYHSLRDDEDNITSPTQVLDVIWQRRFQPYGIGGDAGYAWSLHAHRRPSGEDRIGRDLARASLGLDWNRAQILQGGLLLTGRAGLDADFYTVRDDAAHDGLTARATPWASAELRWPLTGSAARAVYVVEPVAQLVWSPIHGDSVPNEDSRQIEFDEGNLFGLSRFPGHDAREGGLRANLGVAWTRYDPAGWEFGVTAGRVLRHRPDPGFSAAGPMGGNRSDWLLAARYADISGLTIANRMLFDDGLTVNRDEARLGWARPGLQLGMGYVWMRADAAEDRSTNLSEMTADIGWQLAPGWWGTAHARHDFVTGQAQRAGFGVTYRNECITVDFAASRRFVAEGEVRRDTDFDFSVRLGGFGAQAAGPGTVARRSCMR